MSYSWWWGLDLPSSSLDGSIVLGGYDAAKTNGPNYSLPIQPSAENCAGLYTTVKDMTLGFPNGTVSSLMADAPASQPFIACIEPEVPVVMVLQEDPHFNAFTALTQTAYIGREPNPALGFWGMLYEPENVSVRCTLL